MALLLDLDPSQAAAVVARIADGRCRLPSQQLPLPLSLSIGWACGSNGVNKLLARADVALYAAKTAGRGRAVAAHDLVDGSANASQRPEPAGDVALHADRRRRDEPTPVQTHPTPSSPAATASSDDGSALVRSGDDR